MASLVKTGLSDGNTLTAVMITDLYDAWMGNKSYDCIEFQWSGSAYRRAFVGCTYHCG